MSPYLAAVMDIRSLLLVTLMFSIATAAPVTDALMRFDLRADGVGVRLLPPGVLEAEFAAQHRDSALSTPLPEDVVEDALATGIDWVRKGAVTPAKDQGAEGTCGTFGRVAAAEGQYAIHSGHRLRNFSEEELVDCIGWDKDQPGYWATHGFMDSHDYPYNGTGTISDPPIKGRPCRYDATKVIAGTADGHFNGSKTLQVAHDDERQLAAWIFKYGPVSTGINGNVFGLRDKGCEATGSCFITKQMCANATGDIDHSITLAGFGTDPVHGDYWLVKNSWSTKFANNGFIKVARGQFKTANDTDGCAHIGCCGWVPCYGDCPGAP